VRTFPFDFRRRLKFRVLNFFSPEVSLSSFGPNGRKATIFSLLQGQAPSGGRRGAWESGAVPVLELLNCRKKEAFVAGNTALSAQSQRQIVPENKQQKKKGSTTAFFGTSVIHLPPVLKRRVSFLRCDPIREVVRF
jgi:hypothetical protein